MKLIISNNSFAVNDVTFDRDSNGKPIDIFVSAPKETCDAISEFAHIGYCYSDECHSGLFARLDDFSVEP